MYAVGRTDRLAFFGNAKGAGVLGSQTFLMPNLQYFSLVPENALWAHVRPIVIELWMTEPNKRAIIYSDCNKNTYPIFMDVQLYCTAIVAQRRAVSTFLWYM
jgi:hypothetical protein